MADESDLPQNPPVSMQPALVPSRQVPLDLVDMAAQIQHADQMLSTMTGGKLSVIADQIRQLQQSARALLEKAKQDASLHRVTCLFRKRASHIYHLYRAQDTSLYFSMLSPEDWGGSPPDVFEGSFRLEPDMSWTPVDRTQKSGSPEVSACGFFDPTSNNRP